MKTNKSKLPILKKDLKEEQEINLSGYPLYSKDEDIFNNEKVDSTINPEDITKTKIHYKQDELMNERGLEDDDEEDNWGSDLDIPGAELDDEREMNGNEDEENNYYSLGGDDHNDLDED